MHPQSIAATAVNRPMAKLGEPMNQMKKTVLGNGALTLPAAWNREFTVFGGPFRESVNLARADLGLVYAYTVKLAPEINLPCDLAIHIQDFSIPTTEQIDSRLPDIMRAIADHELVYIGCMGGMGRTGLVLAIIAKAWGIPKPVEYVRANYYAHAVETAAQYKFVDEYVVKPDVLKIVSSAKFWSFFGWQKHLTYDAPALLKV